MVQEVVGEIEEGALFIADAHYPNHGNELLILLQKIESGELALPQLFLMGDIFDLLFGYSPASAASNHEAITLLRSIAKKVRVYYFEGNHDFTLGSLLENITVYSRGQQPVCFSFGGKKAALAHGDKYGMGLIYEYYTGVLRSPFFLRGTAPLHPLIIQMMQKRLRQKDICRPFEGFAARVAKIMEYYDDAEMVIEGHFHQGKILGNYCSLPSLACQKELAEARDGKIVFIPFAAKVIPL